MHFLQKKIDILINNKNNKGDSMKIFIIIVGLLFSYSGKSEGNDIPSKKARLNKIIELSSQCSGAILGFNHALKLMLGKDLSNNSEFKRWKKEEGKKSWDFNSAVLAVGNVYKTEDIQSALSEAIAKGTMLHSLNCGYRNKLMLASTQQIQGLIK